MLHLAALIRDEFLRRDHATSYLIRCRCISRALYCGVLSSFIAEEGGFFGIAILNRAQCSSFCELSSSYAAVVPIGHTLVPFPRHQSCSFQSPQDHVGSY